MRSTHNHANGAAKQPLRARALLELAVVFSPPVGVLLLFQAIPVENPLWFVLAVWLANIAMLLLIGVCIARRGDTWSSIGLPLGSPSLRQILIAVGKSLAFFLMAVSAFVAATILMANLVGIPDGADLSKYNYLRGNPGMFALSLLGSYIVASFGEEVVYRGFLITRLEELLAATGRGRHLAALVLSSLIFGMAHFEWGLTGIVQTTAMGAALAFSFRLNRGVLWPLILAHGYMDTLLLTQLFLAPETGP